MLTEQNDEGTEARLYMGLEILATYRKQRPTTEAGVTLDPPINV